MMSGMCVYVNIGTYRRGSVRRDDLDHARGSGASQTLISHLATRQEVCLRERVHQSTSVTAYFSVESKPAYFVLCFGVHIWQPGVTFFERKAT